ncbi:STAS domain-containing protein [Nocardia sp. NPDC058519]|uniref:STAS domain-containing protein n=1 Tax=Nocardia sp. NPDC058519 TaxID=3346535 RepID=UPI003668E8DB
MTAEGISTTAQVRVETLPAASVVTVEGEVDMATAPLVQSGVDEALDTGARVLIVDLSQVKFFGSAGLSVLLTAAEKLPESGLRVVASAAVRRPIEITGLDKLLTIFDTVEQAMDSSV